MKINPVVSYFKWKDDLEMPFMKFHRHFGTNKEDRADSK